MKTRMALTVIAAALAVLAGFASCGTSKGIEARAEASSARISAQAEKAADDFRVIDWKDRSIGEIASPVWLLPAVRGNWNSFKTEWPVGPGRVLKTGVARHATLNGAQTIADVQYAARLASQLKQAVLARAAISLDSDGEFDMVNNAATQTSVNIAGQERLTDFWQLVETTGADGKKTRMYNYWVVYAVDSAVWDQLAAKYMHDMVEKLPDTKTQATIAAMFDELNAETKFEREKSDAEFRMELAAREQALREPPKSSAELRAALRSDDPATRAAAGTTAADIDYVASLRALTAAAAPNDVSAVNDGSGTKTGVVVVTNASTYNEDSSVTIKLVRTNDSHTLFSDNVPRGNSVTWRELPPGQDMRILVTDSEGKVTSSYLSLSAGQTRSYSYNGLSVY